MEIVKAKRRGYQKIQKFLDVDVHLCDFFFLFYPQIWKKENTQFTNKYLMKLRLVQNGVKTKRAGSGGFFNFFFLLLRRLNYLIK